MFAIRKTALDDELARLEDLLSRQETRIQQAFLEFVREAKDPRLVRQAADLLSRGAVDDALALLDSHIARLASVIPAVIQNAATAELAGLAAAIQPIRPTVAVSFDPTDPEAATKIRDATMEFIVQFTDAQRESTRQALAGGFDSGAGTQEMARAFRDSIGLTSTQEAAVRNYRSLLQAAAATPWSGPCGTAGMIAACSGRSTAGRRSPPSRSTPWSCATATATWPIGRRPSRAPRPRPPWSWPARRPCGRTSPPPASAPRRWSSGGTRPWTGASGTPTGA
jgi:hypothetical protein